MFVVGEMFEMKTKMEMGYDYETGTMNYSIRKTTWTVVKVIDEETILAKDSSGFPLRFKVKESMPNINFMCD